MEGICAGGGIIEVSADNDALIMRSQRTCQGDDAIQREPNATGIQLVKLNDDWDYCRLSKTSNQTGVPSSTSFIDVTYDRQEEVDAGSFEHVSGTGDIALKTAGHYLVLANTYIRKANNSTRSAYHQRLALDDNPVAGSRTTVYLRGNQDSDSCNDGSAAIGMIIETTSANQVLSVECNKETGQTPDIIASGTAVAIVKLPDDADYIRLDDSGTDNFNPDTMTALGWDTELERDAAGFGHSDSQITAAADDDYLFLCALFDSDDSDRRMKWLQRWQINDQNHANGNWSGIVLGLTGGDNVEVVCERLGNGPDPLHAEIKGVQGMRIGSTIVTTKVANAAATDVAITTATFNGTINIADRVYDVYVYYGTDDEGSVAGDWDESALIGEYRNVTGQDVDYDATGLSQDTTYYYRFMLSNDVETVWSSSSESFDTVGPIVITNRTAAAIAQTTATLRGELVSGGSGDTYLYWGPTDGGESIAAWSNVVSYGVLSALPTQLESNVTGLLASKPYHYRYYATNALSAVWAPSTMVFTTDVAAVSIAAASVTEGHSGTADATFTVTLSEICGTDMAVDYDVDDYTAVAGSDYVDVSDTLTIPAGQPSGQFTVAAVGDRVTEYPSEKFTVTLSSPSNCAIATATAFGTIVDDDVDLELKQWDYKMKITFNGYAGASTLTNFPALVVFNNSLGNFAYDQFTSAEGCDLRFSDSTGQTYLSYEIEKWNTSGDSYVWVRLPELSGTDTYIWAHWGNRNLLGNTVSEPTEVAGCVLWLDAEDIDGQDDGTLGNPANGDPVATWVDKSGRSHDVSQSTGADRPTLIASVVGGKPVVRFDANNEYLTRSDALGFSGNSAMTVFMVIEADDAVARRAMHLGKNDGANWKTIGFATDSSFRYNDGNRIFANDPMNGSFGIGTWMTEIGGTGGSGRFFKNGDEKSQTGATNPTTAKDLVDGELLIGQGRGNNGSFSDRFLGDIAEIIVYDRALTAAERNRVGYYLEQKYGLTTAYTADAVDSVSPPSYALDGSTWSEGFEAVYHLSETNSTRFDSTLNNHNGTPMGDATDGVGNVDGGAEVFRELFDTNDGDHFDLPKNFGLFDGSLPFSVSMWLKPTTIPTLSGNTRDPIAFAPFGENDLFWGFGSGSPDTELGVRVDQGGWYSPCSVGPLPSNTWSHVTTTFGASGAGNWKMYMNGGTQTDSGTRTGAIGSRAEENAIGGVASGDNRWFDGCMDEVRISRVVRSPDWVQATWKNMNNNGAFNAHGATSVRPPTVFILW